MRKYDLKLIAQRINEMLLDDECILFTALYKMTLDIIETQLYKSHPQKRTSRLAGSLDFQRFFSQRNCQNTDFKQPKYIVLGTPKKLDKIPKNGQNRF